MWVYRMLKDLGTRGAAGGVRRMGCQGCAASSGYARDGAGCPLALPAADRAGTGGAAGVEGTADPPALEIRVLRREGHSLVRIAGEADLATACSLHFSLRALVADTPRLALDVAELAFIDALGIRMLRQAHEQAAGLGGWVRLIGVRPQLDMLLELLGLDEVFPAYEDEDAVSVGVLPRA
ncbi:STAS domain-containing protein [Actinospica durhamensis]|uniref:STAS domain-containing protein n=1 Tax=Actinospica durhamensis TaxID=1508375 RepID=A0A941IS70_9ACTN|nr:STAS domain-containing protein [Actinospica durhamensis]MBR7834613.1 STAS domain-containing protein [Actinospica durhamensis]